MDIEGIGRERERDNEREGKGEKKRGKEREGGRDRERKKPSEIVKTVTNVLLPNTKTQNFNRFLLHKDQLHFTRLHCE